MRTLIDVFMNYGVNFPATLVGTSAPELERLGTPALTCTHTKLTLTHTQLTAGETDDRMKAGVQQSDALRRRQHVGQVARRRRIRAAGAQGARVQRPLAAAFHRAAIWKVRYL